MGYPGFGQPAVRQSVHVGPRRSILLAAPEQGAPPEFDHMVAKGREGARVGGHGVVGEEAPHRAAWPSSLFSNVLVPASPKVLRDFQQLRLLPVTPRVARQQEATPPRSRADVGEAEEVEGPRFAVPSLGPVGRGMPFLSCAALRTRSIPDDGAARFCARTPCGPATFPSAPALGSTHSSPGRPGSFAGFTATTARSDFSSPFIAGYGFDPSPTRTDGALLPRPVMRSPGSRTRSVHTCWVSDHARPIRRSR